MTERPPFPYAELHTASAFSFLRGATLPEDLARRAADLELEAVALTDVGGISGAPRFYQALRGTKVRAIVGAEIPLERGRLTLLVENREGYKNLCRLLTAAARGRPKGHALADRDLIARHAQGLHCLAGGDEGPDAGEEHLRRLREIFPARLHIEIQRHRERVQERRNQILVSLSRRLDLPLVATNGVLYGKPCDRELHDVLTCIRHHTPLARAGRLLPANRERHLKSGVEMARLFSDLPEALRGNVRLSESLDFTLKDLGYRFPDYPVPAGETADSFLRKLCREAAPSRFSQVTPQVTAQLDRELTLIEKLGLAGYFLIVWDIVEFCRSERILVQGRGSAANSAVCYALSITAVDPIERELLFERFLSEERGEWPDIDLDLPSGGQREKVIQHLYQKYGPHGAAMTANVITYRSRSSAREVGKALGLSAGQIEALSRRIAGWGFSRVRDDPGKLAEEIREAGLDPEEEGVRHFVRMWRACQNLPRHLGQHSGGMVIAAGRLDEVVPLEPATMPERTVLQWDKDDCADLGIVKVDLLGLGMLAAIEEAIPIIHEREGVKLDLASVPKNDPKVYAALRAADTVGVFQLESRAQMATLPRNAPREFYDLVTQVAIIRPGPIVGGMMHAFFERRRDPSLIDYPHPSLEPILKRTLGVPLFQEQLLRIAMVAAGFSGGEAEELRRAMGFKRSVERMVEIERKLREGMKKNNIGPEAGEKIIRAITSFALYGFPESHAASFAHIAYFTAYLKVHHPAVFCLALLNAWPMGFYHPATLVQDAGRHGVKVRPIDVARSGWKCRWEESAVRLGLRFLKGLRRTTGEGIEREQTKGPFESLEDFFSRCRPHPGEMDRLAGAGALSGFGLTRRGALWQAARAARPAGPLFERLSGDSTNPLPEMTPAEETRADYETADLTAGPHFLTHRREELGACGIDAASDLAALPDGRRVRAAGNVIVRQRPETAKGFVFLTLEDETGMVQAIVRPDLFAERHAVIVGSDILVIEGILQKQAHLPSIRAERIWPLPSRESIPSHDFR